QFRRYFFRGMAALLPTILTLWLFVACYNFVQNNISSHINQGLVYLLSIATDSYPSVSDEEVRSYVISHDQSWLSRPDGLNQEIKKPEVQRSVRQARLERFWVNGVGSVAGFVIALVGVCFMGVVLASVAGKALWVIIESVLIKTPVLKSVYPHVKQMTDFLFSDQKLSFSRVVAVQYPRQGVWSVGMVTGAGLRRLKGNSGVEMLTVFMPTSPTPFTGFIIMVPRDETIDLEMSIEQAVRFFVSGGVLSPDSLESGVIAETMAHSGNKSC
ncbi:MAG: DUF502 domain-containing protein, partial [Sedimentisphaerales bacterium]|nr:DUF502 domain-containing protein [Sedimentisphaerales bacterium]